MEQQFSILRDNPDIIVATPGRFLHICVEMDLKLSNVQYVVFDEADRWVATVKYKILANIIILDKLLPSRLY